MEHLSCSSLVGEVNQTRPMASQLLVDWYLRGRSICAKEPVDRSEEELVLLKEWLLERSKLFKATTKDGFLEVCKHASLKVVGKDQLVYQQEDVVGSFFVILRGSVSLMVDPQFHPKPTVAQSVLKDQAHTNTAGKQKSAVKIPSKGILDHKCVSKCSLGTEVDSLGAGDYFGQEALLQVNDFALFSALATEVTELLVIEDRIFNEYFLPYFQNDLYSKALFLANLDLFSNWSSYLLRQLAILVKEITFKSDECILRQNLPLGSRMFLLKSGSVKLSVGTESNPQPAAELLNLIKPPKNYLAEILAESSPSKKNRRSQIRQSSVNTSSTTLQGSSLSSTSQALVSQSRLSIRPTFSAPPRRKKVSRQKCTENRRPIMGFRLKEPRPQSSYQLCCLTQGEMLNHIEAICKVKHSLLNAVSLSNTVVYSINISAFMQLLEKKASHTLLLLTEQVSERVQLWLSRNPRVTFFKPLLEVLQQSIMQLTMDSGNVKRHSRKVFKRSIHSPEKRAYAAVKTLGKNLTPHLQVIPSTQLEAAHSSNSSSHTETTAMKLFVIRQLTSTSETHNSCILYVTKEHTSFDSPLPRKNYSPLYNLELPILPKTSPWHPSGFLKGCFQDSEQLPDHLFAGCNSRVSDNVEDVTLTSPEDSSNSSVTLTLSRKLEDGSDQLCAFDIESCATLSADDLGMTGPDLEQYIRSNPWDSHTDDSLEDSSTEKLDPLTLPFNKRRCTPESHTYRKAVPSWSNREKPTLYKEVHDFVSRRTRPPVPVPRPPVNLTPATRPYYT